MRLIECIYSQHPQPSNQGTRRRLLIFFSWRHHHHPGGGGGLNSIRRPCCSLLQQGSWQPWAKPGLWGRRLLLPANWIDRQGGRRRQHQHQRPARSIASLLQGRQVSPAAMGRHRPPSHPSAPTQIKAKVERRRSGCPTLGRRINADACPPHTQDEASWSCCGAGW